MSELKATHPVSLQFLLNEDLYLIDSIEIVQPSIASSSTESHSEPETIIFDYLGENNKYFLLLVNYPDHKVMAPKELEALQAILSAKKMELNDVAIVNMHRYPSITLQQLKAYFACNKIVIFGISPAQLQLPSLSSNQATEHQGIKLLPTFAFSEMMDNVEKKKTFWNVMKGF